MSIRSGPCAAFFGPHDASRRMNIVICGAGHVGSYTAEVLAGAGHNITVIDTQADRLRAIGETMDVATLRGNAAAADILRQAGADSADMVVAATNSDEVNLLAASVAKGVGAAKSIARVHHSAYFAHRGLDYQQHLNIDQLICPEFSTAIAIARTLRNPGALAIEDFARGTIEVQEFPIGRKAPAIGKSLMELAMPPNCRLAAITREGNAFIPGGATTIEAGDNVILVGNAEVFTDARKLFHDEKLGRRRIVIMGGPPMAVWLCRALQTRDFSIRLFEIDPDRAGELAEKLDWITVLQADPTDRTVFEEEHLDQVDAFVALLDDDEHNILGCAWAKSLGVKDVIAVVQRPNYMHLLPSVGIDRPFSPRRVAVKEIEQVLDDSPLRRMSSLAEGYIDVYRVRVGESSEVVGKRLRDIKLTPNWMIAVLQHDGETRVPSADDRLAAGDTIQVIGRHGEEKTLRKLFATG
jgi:trk system potassium uptake protein TrkA